MQLKNSQPVFSVDAAPQEYYDSPIMSPPAAKSTALRKAMPWIMGTAAAAPLTHYEYQGFNPFMPGLKDSNPTTTQKATAFGLNALSMGQIAASLRNHNMKLPLGLAVLGSVASTPMMHLFEPGVKALENSNAQTQVQMALDQMNAQGGRQRNLMLGAGLLGAGAIGATGLGLGLKALRNQEERSYRQDVPRVRVTLPTKDPTDEETHVEIPMDHPFVTQQAINKMRRDIRDRLRQEGKERTKARARRRDPESGDMIPLSLYQEKYAATNSLVKFALEF